MILNQNEKTVINHLLRQFIYFGLIFAFIFGVHFMARIYGADTFEEGGVVEDTQLILLLVSTLAFLFLGCQTRDFKNILVLLASCSLFAACRELDSTFDRLVPVVHWKFAFLFPVAAIAYAWKNYKMTIAAAFRFFKMPAFYMMYLAIILILPVAQCIGHGPFVKSVLGPDRVADIKEFYEEAMEVVGYFIIFLSTVELRFNLKEKD